MKKSAEFWAGYWDCKNGTEHIFKGRADYWVGFGKAYEEDERVTALSLSADPLHQPSPKIPTIEDIKACLS